MSGLAFVLFGLEYDRTTTSGFRFVLVMFPFYIVAVCQSEGVAVPPIVAGVFSLFWLGVTVPCTYVCVEIGVAGQFFCA